MGVSPSQKNQGKGRVWPQLLAVSKPGIWRQ